MSGGWDPSSWEPERWDSGGWVEDVSPVRDSWAEAYGTTDDVRSGPAGLPGPVVMLAASGGAVAATALGLVVLLLGGFVVALIVGVMVLLGACAVGSAYLRGAR